MRELRTLKRTPGGSRVRSVQGRLSIEFVEEDEAGGDPAKTEPPPRSLGFRRPGRAATSRPDPPQAGRTPPPTFHPLAYRSVVADWPVEWREQWGRRANALEEQGLSWRDAETQAFVEVWHAHRRADAAGSSPPPPPEPVPAADASAPADL